MSAADGAQGDLNPVFLERLVESIAASLGLPTAKVEEAVTKFLLDEIRDLDPINAVRALGVDKRRGGPNDGAE